RRQEARLQLVLVFLDLANLAEQRDQLVDQLFLGAVLVLGARERRLLRCHDPVLLAYCGPPGASAPPKLFKMPLTRLMRSSTCCCVRSTVRWKVTPLESTLTASRKLAKPIIMSCGFF